MERINWANLPEAVRHAIQAHTGPVLAAERVSAGRNSQIAALLHAPAGQVFIKGVRSTDRRVVTQAREATINPFVRQISPRLLWPVTAEGWNVLGFERVDGRRADFSPGSRDLPTLAETMRLLTRTPDPGLPLKRIEQRWADLAEPAALEQLAGDTLCHTDLHPDNVLISPTAGRAYIVDWAWPTLGAAWIDPACLALWLVATGHTPEQAEAWASQVPSWHTATVPALDTFTIACARSWQEIADADQQAWKRQLAGAARTWADFRLGGPGAATQV